MNETELLRRLVEEPPPRDQLAMARARQRLRDQMAAGTSEHRAAEAPSAPRPRIHRWLVALVGLLVAAFALQVVLPTGNGGPSNSAAQELVGLGRVAAGARSLSIPAGSYLYDQVEEVRLLAMSQLGDESASFTIVVHDTVRNWLGPDGSGRRTTTFEDVSFESAADEQTWRQDGTPPLPQAGSTSQESYAAGQQSYYDLDSLPTDPDALLAAIRAGAAGPAPVGDLALLSRIGTLLAQGNASPQLRQGLFDVVAGLPSVTLDRNATDPIGRPGVGVRLSGGGRLEELIFDPDSSAILATEFRVSQEGVSSWQAFSDMGLAGSLNARPQPTPFSAK